MNTVSISYSLSPSRRSEGCVDLDVGNTPEVVWLDCQDNSFRVGYGEYCKELYPGMTCVVSRAGRVAIRLELRHGSRLTLETFDSGGPCFYLVTWKGRYGISRSFRSLAGYGDTINRDSLFEFLDLGYFSPFSLPYSNIFRLLDGYRVELEFGLDNESIAERLIESVYAGIGESAGRVRSRQIARSRWRREQFAAEFARLLTLDVEERLSPHGRATLCLSSGKDSVLIARILSDAGVSTHIDACHLSSPLFGLDESESVARVANRFALPVEMVTPGADRILTLFDGLHREDLASGNLAWSGIKLLTEAAEGTDLVLSGDGSGGVNRSVKPVRESWTLRRSWKYRFASGLSRCPFPRRAIPFVDFGFWRQLERNVYRRHRCYLPDDKWWSRLVDTHFMRVPCAGPEAVNQFGIRFKYPLFQYDVFRQQAESNGAAYYAPYANKDLIELLQLDDTTPLGPEFLMGKGVLDHLLRNEKAEGLISPAKSALAIDLIWIISQIIKNDLLPVKETRDSLELLLGKRIAMADIIQSLPTMRSRGSLPRKEYYLVHHFLVLSLWNREFAGALF